jgi:hypothetical protein
MSSETKSDNNKNLEINKDKDRAQKRKMEAIEPTIEEPANVSDSDWTTESELEFSDDHGLNCSSESCESMEKIH